MLIRHILFRRQRVFVHSDKLHIMCWSVTYYQLMRLVYFAYYPLTSTRSVPAEMDIQHEIMRIVLHAEKLQSLHVQKVQLLVDVDYLPPIQSSYPGCLMPQRIIHNFLPLIYSQMKTALRKCDEHAQCAYVFVRKFPHCLVESATGKYTGQGLSAFCLNVSMEQINLFSYSMSSRICYREYRLLCARTHGS